MCAASGRCTVWVPWGMSSLWEDDASLMWDLPHLLDLLLRHPASGPGAERDSYVVKSMLQVYNGATASLSIETSFAPFEIAFVSISSCCRACPFHKLLHSSSSAESENLCFLIVAATQASIGVSLYLPSTSPTAKDADGNKRFSCGMPQVFSLVSITCSSCVSSSRQSCGCSMSCRR